ncbi:MAG TPA: chemotaxis protein CheB [Oligoflexus sp.]|uniref:chemotaxis protein CheB n=1 Tax=Oligoflexus sp. TaxID=1971216 RepID=UPI002D3B70FF|nr:chemotaxis protein CheB [Oligoflexus sp.]HYX31572.1 chemotaxis protein CheB [Oligoflexus sp.]
MSPSLEPKDRSLIAELCFRLTGSRPESTARLETCYVNLLRRMRRHGLEDMREYLALAHSSDQEFAELLSALTIHTTSWFREAPHFERLREIGKQYAEQTRDASARSVFRVLSAACSSGEEAYTMALILEPLRELFPHFDYAIDGWDIDPVSVEKARLAVYDRVALDQIPKDHHRHLRLGRDHTQHLFTVSKNIRQRCQFHKHSLEGTPLVQDRRFHVVFCRNVLIYFKPEQVDKIVYNLLRLLVPQGTLFLGHSEGIDARKFGVKSLGSATYLLPKLDESSAPKTGTTGRPNPKILVIDDSPIAKMALRRALENKGCDVHSVTSLREASSLVRQIKFDQAVIDLSLTTKDHNHWVEEQRRKGALASVVVIGSSSGTEAEFALGALEHGAQEFIDKRRIMGMPDAVAVQLLALLQKAQGQPTRLSGSRDITGRLVLRPPSLILVGASTGGTEALLRLLKDMPRPCPPVLVVQHIANSFAKSFAERLAQVSGLKLGQPSAGQEILLDHLYMAWDDYHIGLKMRGGIMQLDLSTAPPQHSVRPAVDFLFQSALHLKNPEHFMAVLLTGMGKDGARGLLQLKNAGAMTLTQDEASCVVYGMPGEAMALGASNFSGTPEQLRIQINQALALASQPRQRAQ